MNRLASSQKTLVQQFAQIAETSEKVSIEVLRATGWNLQAAFEMYFNQGLAVPAEPELNMAEMEAFFQHYKEPNQDDIMAEGVGQLCSDLEVDPSDPAVLVLAWATGARQMGVFTWAEFKAGLTTLKVSNLQELKDNLEEMRQWLNRDDDRFGEIYKYAFGFACDAGQKSLGCESACVMWRLIFKTKNWGLLEPWCNFVQEKYGKAISRDTWHQLLQFSKSIKTDLSNYDPEGAWPCVIDDFVEHVRETRSNHNVIDLS